MYQVLYNLFVKVKKNELSSLESVSFFKYMYLLICIHVCIQVKLKSSEEEKKTVETRLQVAQKDLATIRERESKLTSEKVN